MNIIFLCRSQPNWSAQKKENTYNETLKMAFIKSIACAAFQEEALAHIFAWLVV